MLPTFHEDALSAYAALVHLGWWGSLGLQQSAIPGAPQPGPPQSCPVGLTVGKRLV